MDKSTLDYLAKLKKNNSKAWFEDNRALYNTAKEDFAAFIEDLIKETAKFDPGVKGLSPKDCMFRINRDVRFSKDKSPYKTEFGAHIQAGGRKALGGGYFIRVGPGGHTGVAGGMHGCESKHLNKIRAAIDEDSKPLKKILNAAAFKRELGELKGEKLKTAPKGYPKDHPDLELLQFKDYFVWKAFADKDVLAAKFVKDAAKIFKLVHPLNRYLTQVVTA